jgi:anaerobic selenocysteine-containing dehydrogenase
VVTVQKSVCRICTTQCGILVTIDDERVVEVRGDAEHPAREAVGVLGGTGHRDEIAHLVDDAEERWTGDDSTGS